MNDSYSWFVTTHNRTIIPTDPMSLERAKSWRKSAQMMVDAGFFIQLDLMKYDLDTHAWLPEEEL